MGASSSRLLVIDDDQGLCEIFDLFMTKQGFTVASAGDGALGLAKIPVYKPHLIVLDLMMPNLNGFEVLHRLRETEHSKIPVIVITGFSDEANEEIVRREPQVVDFLKKPVDYGDLARRIKDLLEGRPGS